MNAEGGNAGDSRDPDARPGESAEMRGSILDRESEMTFQEKNSSAEFRAAALHDAVDGLREKQPEASASVAFTKPQIVGFVALAIVIVVCLVLWLVPTLTVLVAIATAVYVITMLDRIVMFRDGLASGPLRVSDERATAIPDDELPTYTVLMPAYDEPEIIGELISAMSALDYPRDKLQILLLLEGDDDVTINAAHENGVDEHSLVTPLEVPPADPRTKPKACNYGLHFATGEIITIYDAEDLPEPLQLRRVAAAFSDMPDNIACIQGMLNFHNGDQNTLTAWFAADYGLWFGYLLPGLMRSSSPIPLGGTTNHLRRSVLDHIGAWDPFNVTEDADLGVRIAEKGYRTAVIESTTLEEANPDPINWIRQRSRWYKGYMQTWLVHMRNPLRTWRNLGTFGMYRFTILMAGTPLIACVNMLFWMMTFVWVIGQVGLIAELFPPGVYYPAMISFIFGNSATIYMNLIALREDQRSALMWPALVVPLYWVLMSIAALKGMWQMISAPSYWEKTAHGLANDESASGTSGDGDAGIGTPTAGGSAPPDTATAT